MKWAKSHLCVGKEWPLLLSLALGLPTLVAVALTSAALNARAGDLTLFWFALGSALFDAMDWLTNAVTAATQKNLEGLKVNRERCTAFLHGSVGLATLLNTRIGYAQAAQIAKLSEQTGRPVRDLVEECGLMGGDEFDQLVLKAARDGRID